jgi:hypothetical protein
MPARTRVLAGAACAAIAAVLAGCGTTTTSATSSVLAKGTTLSIYLSVPPSAASDPEQSDTVLAEQLACAQDSGEVSDFKAVCIRVAQHEVSDNARTAIVNGGAIAYIGELAPGFSEDSVGITNALDLLQVSPSDTALELTQSTPAVSGAPSKFYEDWDVYGRTFAREVPSSAQEAQAQVAEMRSLHLKSLYVGDDGSDYGKTIALAVRQDAPPSITVSASESGAAAIFYGSDSPLAAAKFFDAAPAGAARPASCPASSVLPLRRSSRSSPQPTDTSPRRRRSSDTRRSPPSCMSCRKPEQPPTTAPRSSTTSSSSRIAPRCWAPTRSTRTGTRA